MTVSIVIATGSGRELQARRAAAAYSRETPGDISIVFADIFLGSTLADAWKDAVDGAALLPLRGLVHFTSDELEPHPGWLAAASAACAADRIPSPTLWSADGVELNAGYRVSGGRDWSSAVGSEYPTMSWRQLAQFGTPPITAELGAEYVVRTDYAFTRHA